MRLVATLCVLSLCCGCAVDPSVTEARSSHSLGTRARPGALERARLTRPIHLAIAPPIRAERWGRQEFWSEPERAVIDRWVDAGRQRGVVTEATYLPRVLLSTDPDDDGFLADAVGAARAAGADAVLVVQTSAATSRGANLLSVLYLTIIGMWIVPGSELRATAIAEAMMVGVDGSSLFAFGEGIGHDRTTRPLVYLDEADAGRGAICNALDALGTQLLEPAR